MSKSSEACNDLKNIQYKTMMMGKTTYSTTATYDTQDIEKILEQAQAELGPEYLLNAADLRPPQFTRPKITAIQCFEHKLNQIKTLSTQFHDQIENAKK